MYLILKFGGTSVGTPQRIKELAQLTVNSEPKIVVLSAMSGTTNALVGICNALFAKDIVLAKQKIESLKENYNKVVQELFSKDESRVKGQNLITSHFNYIYNFTLDMFTSNEEKAILAQGELISTALYHYYLEEQGVESILLPAMNFMRLDFNEEPDLNFIENQIKIELTKYPNAKLFITQGYICRNAYGEIDNLKRGGSDYTASIIGAAIRSPEVQIWTDIDGMHNNDPRIVNKTHPINELSFDEAAELAYFGAKILHPTCILPAQKRNIPVRLKNTMQPNAEGTLIANLNTKEGIKAVAAKDGITAINVVSNRMFLAYGFLRNVFEVFERYKTPIDMITTSEVAVSLTIDQALSLDAIVKELETFASVEIDREMSIVSVVGDNLADRSGSINAVVQSMQEIPLRMVSCGGSRNNISMLIETRYKISALKALNVGLFQTLTA